MLVAATRLGALLLITVLYAGAASAKVPPRPSDEGSRALELDLDALDLETLSPADQLERGRQAFDNGEYEQARALLEKLEQYEVELELGREQRQQLHDLLGRILYILDDKPGAERHFFELLKLDPTHELDPIRTPREIVIRFEVVKRAQEKNLELFPVDLPRTVPGLRIPAVANRDRAFAFLPFGAFHFLFLHERPKGMVLLVPQALTLASSIGTYAFLASWPSLSPSTQILAAREALLVVNIITSAVFLAIYTVGVIDGFASQRYIGRAPGSKKKKKVSAKWRWGPPLAVISALPD